jgi:hypothetical protein
MTPVDTSSQGQYSQDSKKRRKPLFHWLAAFIAMNSKG